MQPTVSPPAGTQPLVDQAIADLAGRLSVQPSDVHLVTFEAVVWPDASLGCPQPGIAYIQVQREGYRIALQVGEQVYAYHGGAGRGPFLCEQPEQRTPAAGSMSQ
ncbi:MAG TPA: hypothetical protein VJG32_12885 [Anaerolineae bacterium]|nr:hypothetical protein [Anaerolineae bacterium]